METGQRTIEGFLTARSTSDDHPSSALGSSYTVLSPSKRPRSPSTSDIEPASGSKVRKRSDEDRGNAIAVENDDASSKSSKQLARDERYSFICDKCHKRIWLEDAPVTALSKSYTAGDADGENAGSAGSESDDAIREDALAALRLEHADFHFAQELAAAGDGDIPKRVLRPTDKPSSSTSKKRKKKPADAGIAKFFQKR